MASSTARECARTAVTRARAQAEAAEWAYLAEQVSAAETEAEREGPGRLLGRPPSPG